MSVSASTQIPKTSDPAVFQRQCKVLFEQVLRDPTVQEYGTSGQGQQGIDLLGRRRELAPDYWVGIQCKLTIKAPKLKAGKKGVVRVEATKALEFQPALKELIIATTADDDAALQREAAIFTDEQVKLGRDFTVQVWGWQTLQAHILQHETALKFFWPDGFPHMDRLLRGQEKLREDVAGVAGSQVSVLASQEVMLEILQRVDRQTATSATAVARQAVWDDRSVDTLLDRQVDQYRDMLNAGQPRTALGLLEGLWNSLPDGVEGRIRFRVKANIAACKLRLGDEAAAGELYLKAYEHAPDDPKAISLKVLGHILLNQPEQARAFGRAAYAGTAHEGPLVAYLITAARFLPDEGDPFELIPDVLEDDPFVAVAKIDYLRTRSQRPAWWQLAREGHARHPDDDHLARFAAEADIDRACQWSDEHGRQPLHGEMLERVVAATSVLQRLFDKGAASEAAWDDYRTSMCGNMATGFRLLRQHDRAKAIISSGLAHAPDDQALKEAHLLIALEAGDYKTAAQVLPTLPPSRDVIFGRLQVAANTGDWAGILTLADEVDKASLAPDDRAFFESLTLLAHCKLGKVDDPHGEVRALLEKHPDQIVVPIILYEIAVNARDGAWATELFKAALQNQGRLNSASRFMLARLAEREGDAEKIIDLLDGHIDLTHDSDDLRMLARAFVNATVRKVSLAFIEALPADLSKRPFYARVIGSIHFNRGALDCAEKAFQQALAGDPTDVSSHLGLINTWLRQDRRDLVEKHLSQIEPDRLQGAPAYLMGLAQLLVAFRRPELGLAFGYDTALNNRDDQRTVMLYIGLILPDPTGALIPPVGPEIQIDCWVKAQRRDGQTLSFVIENGPDRPSLDHYSPEHALAKLFLGQKKDSVVVSVPQFGTEQSWRVVEIKHKYLALLHDLMETLPSRFPDAKGFYQFQMEGDDLTPFLNQVRTMSEQDAEILSHYLEDGYPLGLAATLRGKSSVEFAGHVVSRGDSIRTCVGTHEERAEGIRLVRAARERGAVLDTFTAWVAYSLGLMQLLKSVFKRVALPQSSIDELREWRKRFEPEGDEPLMTVGYADGQYFREEISAERLSGAASTINNGIERLCAELEIVPAAAPSAPSETEEKLLDIARHGFLDPVYISVAEDLLLVSEDLHYRNIARLLHGRAGAWLQAVLMVAHDARALDSAGYAEAVCGLALQKHDHVTLNAATLIEIARRDQSEGMERFKAAAAFIGTPSADLESHSAVSLEFLRSIWHTEVPYVKKSKAAGLMLERLAPLLARHGQLESAYRVLVEKSDGHPLLREYLIAWARGHFLDLS